MEPLTWGMAASLLIKYGPEVADFIVKKWNARGEVSLPEWQELMVLANKTPNSQLLDAVARAGIPLDNEHVKNLMAMLPPRV